MAQKEGIAFFEVSAKTGDNIKNMFYSAVADLPIFAESDASEENLVGCRKNNDLDDELNDEIIKKKLE